MQQNLISCQPLPLLLEGQILVKKCKDLAGKRLKLAKTGDDALNTGISFIACQLSPKRSGFYSSGMSYCPRKHIKSYGYIVINSLSPERPVNGSWVYCASLRIITVKSGYPTLSTPSRTSDCKRVWPYPLFIRTL